MSYYRSMPISQLIAGLNDANELITQGNMSDEDMEALASRLTAETELLCTLGEEHERLSQEGIGQQDLHRLEEISPGVTAGLNSGDYTFLASQNGLEPALNAIDWGMVARWGIVGVIIAAIIALIVKIRGGKGKTMKRDVTKEINDNYAQGRRKIREDMAAQIRAVNENNEKIRDNIKNTQKMADGTFQNSAEESIKKMKESMERLKASQASSSASSAPKEVPPVKKEKVFNQKKAYDMIKSNFKTIKEPNDGHISKYLPIEDFKKLKPADSIDDESMSKIYAFCYEYGLTEDRKRMYIGFDLVYNKDWTANMKAVREQCALAIKSSSALADDLDICISCMETLDKIFDKDLTAEKAEEWRSNSNSKSYSFGDVVNHLQELLAAEKSGRTIRSLIKAEVDVAIQRAEVNGFYQFKNLGDAEYVQGDELRDSLIQHIDFVETNAEQLRKRIKRFEDLGKGLDTRRKSLKLADGQDADKITGPIMADIAKANMAIAGHHQLALASVQGCSDYVRYGDVGVETHKILMSYTKKIIGILAQCYDN